LNAARLENTGRNPIVVSCTAIFSNTIQPGTTESWKAGTLFPNVYEQFIQACTSTTSNILIVPGLGSLQCFIASCNTKFDSGVRGGPMLELVFKETIPDNGVIFDPNSSSFGSATASAAQADTMIDTLNASALASPPQFQETFSDLMLKLRSISDTASLVEMSGIGAVNQILYQCNQLINYCTNVNSVNNSLMKMQLNVLQSQVNDLKTQILVQNSTVAIYVTPAPVSLAIVANRTGNALSDLMNLNPFLLATPFVAKNVKVRYYVK
jgi:hypothetical protein